MEPADSVTLAVTTAAAASGLGSSLSYLQSLVFLVSKLRGEAKLKKNAFYRT